MFKDATVKRFGIYARWRIAAQVLAGVLLVTFCLRAQQTATTAAAKPDVPDNLAPHTPPVQPISYSHKTHLALGLECKYCHTNPGAGKMMTFPATSTCMSCHEIVAQDSPAIRKLASYAKSNQPVPWVRVYALTPGITWTHRKHLDANVQCESCHGPVDQMDAMSEVKSVTVMAACITCHKAHNAATVCQTCHVWPSN